MQQAAEVCEMARTTAFGWGFAIGAVGMLLLAVLTALTRRPKEPGIRHIDVG